MIGSSSCSSAARLRTHAALGVRASHFGDVEFDAAVRDPAFFGVVALDRIGGALALRGQAPGVDAVVDQVLLDRGGAVGRELLVVRLAALGAGVADDVE